MTSSNVAARELISPPQDETTLLSVRDLKTHFFADEGTTRAVDGVSFDMAAGKTLGVVGETGCGKSITARSLLGIISPPGRIIEGEMLLRRDSGWVDLAKLPPNGPEMREVRGGDIGLVFQEPMSSFSPVHTVGAQIIEAVRLHCEMSKQDAEKRALELLRMVGIPRAEGVLNEYSWQLSGGLRQRAMIAMALAGQPKLLIADEPTTALDVTTQAQILELIRGLQRQTDMAIMLITHDLGVIAEMADEVLVIYLGRVVEKGPVEEIFAAPRHPYTRALLNSIPSAHAVARGKLPVIAGSVPHPFNRPSGCAFHPRCRHAVEGLCDKAEPGTTAIAPRHEVTCHLYDEAVSPASAIPVPLAELRVAEPVKAEITPATVDRTDLPVLLDVRKLTKFFPIRSGFLGRVRARVRAVDEVSFDLRQGETLALVGESGSGKTTASRAILRALDPDSGEILFRKSGGETVDLAKLSRKQVRPLRSELQMIFQDPHSSLNPRMTVLDIIAEPLLVNGVGTKQERTERVAELLKLVGLRQEYMRRFPHAFSGGQRQRIGIARALALNPRLVVADEPVSALDVSVQAQILNLLLELQDRLGLTYLFVSHDLSVVKHISDRIAVMYVGQVVELGTRDEVLFTPRHPYTSTLLAAVPRPDPTARLAFSPPRGEVADPTNPPSGCYFHPRCPFATEVCRVERPVWQEITPGRRVRCHRAAELDLPGITIGQAG
ncbi:MAG TPA: ABC transporter ATP-binding protein [Actinophytocola sp.]|uniref:ABC transporter ATP-binding protein n=1 Tax=Actinophytocola sp. TaxID=1872138 RepID=UPI002DDD8E95|nr:ABC transporter ATP-binding protein [Actinophytocola sp.]HEV2783086.1 ABC transporter ATP-binding protein [Actinophytocola sp.]